MFDGSNDYVNLGLSSYNFNNSVTYVAYVKASLASKTYEFFGNWEGAGEGLGIGSDNIPYFTVHNGSGWNQAKNSTTINSNQYYVMIGTFDGSNVKLYLDGKLVGTKAASKLTTSAQPIFLGANPNSSGTHSYYSKISLREAMLYDGALSQDQITSLTNYFNSKYSVKTNNIDSPTFEEKSTTPKSVLITYPSGCGSTYTCSYQKDNESEVSVTSDTVSVSFTSDGSVVAKVTDGYSVVTSSYNVTGVNDYTYSGSVQEVTAINSGYYQIELWGAQGASYDSSRSGGLGAYTKGDIYLNKGDKLYLYIGQSGTRIVNTSIGNSFNGGGQSSTSSENDTAGSGGGATDVRLVSGNWNDTSSLRSRIMVAAGGGSAYYYLKYHSSGSDGGTLVGNVAPDGVCLNRTLVKGSAATQKSGGSANQCGDTANSGSFGIGGGSNSANTWNAGGGGGYYGGGAGFAHGANGGSSYISGYAGVNSITSASSSTHTNQTLHYSGKYFINTEMAGSSNTGNGKAKITYIGSTSNDSQKITNVRYIKDCLNGNSTDSTNRWIEIQAINSGSNVAKGKTVTGDFSTIQSGSFSKVTDGIIDDADSYLGTSGGSKQCVIVDLEKEYNLEEIGLWHYYSDGRAYNDTLSVAGSDKSFKQIYTSSSTSESVTGNHIK